MDRVHGEVGAGRHNTRLVSQVSWSHPIYALNHDVTRGKSEKPLFSCLVALLG